jgi:hypothetical protein
MADTHRRYQATELTELLEIADVIDAACESLAMHVPGHSVDDVPLRQALFALLDHPSQALWEQLREMSVAPNFLRTSPADPGALGSGAEAFPSDPAVSFADACYAYGLPDQVCPSKRSLRAILRWAVAQATG